MPQDDDKPAEAPSVPPAEAGAHFATTAADDKAKKGNGDGRWSVLRKQGHRQEDADLSDLVKAWVKSTWPGDDIKLRFVETELEAKLRSWRIQARWWRTAQISIWLLIAILGLLISVFAGFKSGHGFTIIAGALVATLTTLTNALHPSKQASGYLTARLTLRDEGWSLLNRGGEYVNLDAQARYAHFVDAIHKIVLTKRSATNLDALAPG